jgi:DNA primase
MKLTDDEIARAQAHDVGELAIAQGLALRRVGAELIGPCPRCGGADRFGINRAKQTFLCRGCYRKGGFGAIRFIQFLDGVNFTAAVETLIGERRAPVKYSAADNAAERARKIEGAGRIWRASVDPRGTLGEKYLNGRGLESICVAASCAFIPLVHGDRMARCQP